MNNLIVNGVKNIDGMKFHDIEGGFGEGKKSILVKEVANIHERQEAHINEVINKNISRFNDGIDIINLLADENFKIVVDDLGLKTSNRQKYSYLLSERGYSKLLKILEDDVAWEQYDKLVDGYFNMRSEIKENTFDISELSPELQMFNKMLQAVAKSELEQKKIKQQLNEVNHKALEAKEEASKSREELQAIREVVTLDTNSWRKDTATIINKIATKLGGFGHIQPIREEIYNLLDNTYGVKLQSRLLNKQKKMALEGVPKYKIDKVNKLDVISDDKKLINGYVNIVGKMAIKYGVA